MAIKTLKNKRLAPKSLFASAPLFNSSVEGYFVYTHSGEFAPQHMDVRVNSRGPSFQFLRRYRLKNKDKIGLLGRGWEFSYGAKIIREGSAFIIEGGLYETTIFRATGNAGIYEPSNGLYAYIENRNDHFVLHRRFGNKWRFSSPDAGGDLISIEDKNGNVLAFKRSQHEIEITDSFHRVFTIQLDNKLIHSLRDPAGRQWKYVYDENQCLIHVLSPQTQGEPVPTISYDYDDQLRLFRIETANKERLVQNTFDDEGRIVRQKHGGGIFTFTYSKKGKAAFGFHRYRTTVKLKNDSLLKIDHDQWGHAKLVTQEAEVFTDKNEKNRITKNLITRTAYNKYGEVVERVYPSGVRTVLTYDEKHPGILNRGNQLDMRWHAAGARNEKPIRASWTYDAQLQQIKSKKDPANRVMHFEYDDSGNLVRKIYPAVTIRNWTNKKDSTKQVLQEHFAYNAGGQLTAYTDARGCRTEYEYFSVADFTGQDHFDHADGQQAGGYLARIIKFSNNEDQKRRIVAAYRYNTLGEIVEWEDGRGHSTRFEYNHRNHLVRLTGRHPFAFQLQLEHDHAGNAVTATTHFEHRVRNTATGKIETRTSTVTKTCEYNVLGNLITNTVHYGRKKAVTTLERDADENIAKKKFPDGSSITNRYDERGYVVQQTRRVASGRVVSEQSYRYSADGKLALHKEGKKGSTLYHYDNFRRFKGYSSDAGKEVQFTRDESSNIIKRVVSSKQASSLVEYNLEYDELNRCVRRDRLSNGRKSVSFYRFESNGLLSATQNSYGNIISFDYDHSNCLTSISDLRGAMTKIEYDENNNVAAIAHAGRSGNDPTVLQFQYDEIDRLTALLVNGQQDTTISYNAVGTPLHTSFKQTRVEYLSDALSRQSGVHVLGSDGKPMDTSLEWNDADVLTSAKISGGDSINPLDTGGSTGATDIATGVGLFAFGMLTVIGLIFTLPEVIGIGLTVGIVALVAGGSISSGWFIGKGIYEIIHGDDNDTEIDYNGGPDSSHFLGSTPGGGVRIQYTGVKNGITETRRGPTVTYGEQGNSGGGSQGNGSGNSGSPRNDNQGAGGSVWGFTGENRPSGANQGGNTGPGGKDSNTNNPPVDSNKDNTNKTTDKDSTNNQTQNDSEPTGPPPETGHVEWKDELPLHDPDKNGGANSGNRANPDAEDPSNARSVPPGVRVPISGEMPIPDGDGPMGPLLNLFMPTPDGGGPMGPYSVIFMPTPDGTGPMGPASQNGWQSGFSR
jgi:YD repeat-containing protein